MNNAQTFLNMYKESTHNSLNHIYKESANLIESCLTEFKLAALIENRPYMNDDGEELESITLTFKDDSVLNIHEFGEEVLNAVNTKFNKRTIGLVR